MAWRIYYDDGTTWTYTMGLPPKVRRWGVLVILQVKPDGRTRFMSGENFYVYDGDGWLAMDQTGVNDAIINILDRVKCVIAGRMVPDDRFREIYAQAKRDADNGVLGEN